MQAKGAAGDGVLQKLQRSVSAKATPLLALAGMAQSSAQEQQATHELVPLKTALQQDMRTSSAQSLGQSLRPLLQCSTGGLKLTA